MPKAVVNRRPKPKRTLSSSLRQYRNIIPEGNSQSPNTNRTYGAVPLIPRSPLDGGDTESPYGRSSTTTAINQRPTTGSTSAGAERQRLLQPESNLASIVDRHDYGHDADNEEDGDRIDEEADGYDDADQEAAYESEQADSDGLFPPNCTWTGPGGAPARGDPFGTSNCKVWSRIHEIRSIIIDCIDDPYSLEQLKAPRMNIAVVRPLVDKLYNLQDLCIVYCLLANRVQFVREQAYATHHQTVNLTRALLCELLAEKVLRRYNEGNPGPLGLLKLANILVAGFQPFQGAPADLLKEVGYMTNQGSQIQWLPLEKRMTALEIAIMSESKGFLASSACQKVVDAIYRGRIVYTPNSFIDIIPDHWKRRPISLYDPRRAPIWNQYRLIVPRTRNLIEAIQFIILLALYVVVMVGRESWRTTKYDIWEAMFDIYGTGWVLDQIASILEHGWGVYTQNLWSFLDVMFSAQFVLYLALRMHGLRVDHESDPDYQPYGRTALDILSCAAPILVPRIAFNVMSDNMLFLSLRAMMGDFLNLTVLAIWCFAGFLFSLKWLHNGVHEPETIGKWMIWIWFGLDGTGIDQSPDFHWILGPTLMIAFAFLGNTLFLTILVSMLSNTFSMITSNAVQEIQYRRSVLTFMGVKSDAIFAYMPPFNIPALLFLLPLKFVISPRNFHKLNVFLVRSLNMPLLILISLYERQTLWVSERYRHFRPKKIDWKNPNGPRAFSAAWWSIAFQFWDLSRFNVHGDIQAVFEAEPPRSWFEEGGKDRIMASTSKIHQTFHNISDVDSDASSRPSNARRKSTTVGERKRSLRRSSDTQVRRHSGSRAENENSDDMAELKKWISGRRRDSIADFDGGHSGGHETNARLSALEQSVQRIESLLEQLLDNSGEDESQAQEDLRVDAEVEGM